MNNILSEKEYQKYILNKLQNNGYKIIPSTQFDRYHAVDRTELFNFLNDTQPKTMESLRKIYKQDMEEIIVSTINTEETQARGSRLQVLKKGVDISNLHLDLMYTKPATSFNKELNELYQKIFFRYLRRFGQAIVNVLILLYS